MDEKRKKSITQSVSLCPIWPMQAVEKIGKMLDKINQANSIMEKIASTAQNSAIKGGFAAETWHGESFNLDAILKDKQVRAFTDNCVNTPLAKNDPLHDIVIMKGDEQLIGVQLKYYKDADATQKAFRSSEGGIPRYDETDLFLGPSDQIEGIKASAERDMLKNQQTRPEVSRAAEKVRDKTAESIEVEGAQSTPLSKREAEHLGTGSETGKKLHKDMQDGYLDKATIQQTVRAASSAAVITTVIAGSINSFQYIKLLREGKITAEQATFEILKNTTIAAADSALKAGAATASVSMTARSLPDLIIGSGFTHTFARGSIAGATVCAVDLVQCVVLFAAGKMTSKELETRTGKNIFQTGAGVTGASVGAAIGALGGPVGALVGGIIGGLITSLAMTVAIDNHIEKGFQLALANTEHVVSNGMVMYEALEYLHLAQEFYADFHKGLYSSERHFESQAKTMKAQSERLKIKQTLFK